MKKGIVLLMLVLIFLSCSKEERIIKIGVLTPLTGEVSNWGTIQKRATELALEGVDTSKIKIIYADSKANPKIAINAVNKLINVDNVDMIVGSPASNVTLAIAPILNSKKIPLLSSGSTATEVGNAGDYIFRIMPSDEFQSKIMAQWANEIGIKKISVVYTQNSWGEGLKDAFVEDFKKLGGLILSVNGTQQGANDFKTIITKLKNDKVDAIYAPLYPKEGGTFIKQATELGLTVSFLGADVYNTPEFITAGGTAVNGVKYITYGQIDSKEYFKFKENYESKYNVELDNYALYCYDVIKIALRTIGSIKGDINGEKIKTNMLLINDFIGVTGLSAFEGKNSARGKVFDKMVVKDGRQTKIYD